MSHTSLQATVETRNSCWKYFTLFSCDVIGFDFLSSKEGHIGENDLNSVFHPDAFNLAGGKQVLHKTELTERN